MAFEPKTWADGVAGGTPITAEELNRMEQGIEDAQNEGLEIADVTGLESRLTAIENRLDDLENPEG